MPSVAMTATGRFTVKVPTNTRNSLTNALVPGSASAERPASKKAPAMQWRLAGHAAVVGDEPALAPRDEEADDEEQRAGRQPVIDHVEHSAGAGLAGEGEDSQTR